jgi:hypothetical protein
MCLYLTQMRLIRLVHGETVKAKLQQYVGSCDVFKHALISSNFQKSQFKLAVP